MSAPLEFTLRTGIYPSITPELFKESLSGKVALVTGSGRGIGREIAFALAKSGAAVVITGRTLSEVKQTAEDISSTGAKAMWFIADVCISIQQAQLVKEVEEKLGTIDIVVCNAGTNTFMPFYMTEPSHWWKEMEIMVKAPTELTRMVLPTMQKRNMGIIIYTSSRAAQVDLPWTSQYSCAKTSITRFAGVLQNELNILQKDIFGHESNGISIFSIHPGEIETSLHTTAFPETTKREAPYVIEMMDKLNKTRPRFKIGLPAWTCVYLAAGHGKELEGRLVDCTKDLGEVTKSVREAKRPKMTNACA